jgi:hypothetical protein
MGVELPRAGSGAFQATFSVLLQVVGSPFSTHVPSPRGPRHWGQFSACATTQKLNTVTYSSKQNRGLVMRKPS